MIDCEYCGEPATTTHNGYPDGLASCEGCRADILAEDREHFEEQRRELARLDNVPEPASW
jgi:hypothetical protein